MKMNASNYIKNRNQLALTKLRVNKILACIINSYDNIIADRVTYDYSVIGSIKKEDYLRNRLVDDYLENELNVIESGTENFTVNKETSEEYRSLKDGKLHDDPIDIHIVDKGLKDSWGEKSKPYFAIECKRLESTISGYVTDTEKITERDYSRLRLPFEGQLGFIENSSWSHDTVTKLINKNLLSNTKIKTTSPLKQITLKATFRGSYLSEHKKRNNTPFSLFHLFLDYSKIIIN